MNISNTLQLLGSPKELWFVLFRKLGFLIPDKFYLKVVYRKFTGSKLRIENPKTFNEKLQWLKLYDRNPEYTVMVDKYSVKKYIADRVGEQLLIPTLGVWDKFDDIDFDKLPNQFVLKTTHDSGGIIICKDKNTFNYKNAKVKLTQSLHNNFYLDFREWPYKNVPRRIIAEKLMVDESGIELKDYKFFCFNGKVMFLKVDFDRFIEHHANYYTPQWELLSLGEAALPPKPDHFIRKPDNLDEMIAIAEKLAVGIPFVRIDLYDINNKIYFGEITFFPATGMGLLIPEGSDERLGMMLELPKDK